LQGLGTLVIREIFGETYRDRGEDMAKTLRYAPPHIYFQRTTSDG